MSTNEGRAIALTRTAAFVLRTAPVFAVAAVPASIGYRRRMA